MMNSNHKSPKAESAKYLYLKAQGLIYSGEPSNLIHSIMLLHNIIYSIKSDGSKELAFWKGHAAVDLGHIFLTGVDGCEYVDDDGHIYADCYVKADLLKAYDLFKRAMRYGCFDGVVVIAEIYMILGEYDNSAELYKAVIEYGYHGRENAKRALETMINMGRINEIPPHVPAPSSNPSFLFEMP